MISRHTQTILHTEGGPRGNCYQTAIACLLNLPLEAVPHFMESKMWEHECREWALRRGLLYWRHPLKSKHGRSMGWNVPFHWIASGPTKRGTSHSVVYRGYELLWDPHPSRDGILEADDATFFVPLDITKGFVLPEGLRDEDSPE